MASVYPPKKGTAFPLDFTLYTTAGAVVNPSTITKYVSKDGAYPTTVTATPVEVNGTLGMMYVTLTATEMNGDRVRVYITATVANTIPYTQTLYTASYTLNQVYNQIPTKAAITASVWAAAARSLTASVWLTTAYESAKTALKTASYTAPYTVAAITASVWGAAARALTDKANFTLTASYNSAKYALSAASYTTPPTTAAITASVWAASTALKTASYTTPPTVAAITASVWDATTRSLTASVYLTTAYEGAKTAAQAASWTATRAAYLTGAVALQASLSTIGAALPTAAENADAVWDEAIADHVTAGSAGKFLQRVYRYFFNKRVHTNTSVVVYADDGTTPDATMAVSGDTVTVTKAAPA